MYCGVDQPSLIYPIVPHCRLAWIKYYVKNSDADKALELGWDGDMSFIDGPVASIAPSPAAGVASGSALTVDPQKTMCRI